MNKDINLIRDLAKEICDISQKDIQEERRRLWSAHNSFKRVPTPLYIRLGNWEKEIIVPQLKCEDPFLRGHERYLRTMIYQDWLEDDYVIEPWITQRASFILEGGSPWGLDVGFVHTDEDAGAYHVESPIKEEADLDKMTVPSHKIDEKRTARNAERLNDALGDILPVHIDRSPYYQVWQGDISTQLGHLRGIEQVMWDVMDRPEWLHKLLAHMRDGIIKTHEEAEKAGDWTLANHQNQSIPYARELERPACGPEPVKQNQLWGFLAAQEYALISPAHHDEFMLEYQKPILERFAMTSYGCCEDLSQKIDIIRKIKNLRRIAVSPFANAESCAEQIGEDYIISWRPNPSDTVCMGWDEKHTEEVIRTGLDTFKRHGSFADICLKDVNTVQGDPDRLKNFVRVCRRVIESLS